MPTTEEQAGRELRSGGRYTSILANPIGNVKQRDSGPAPLETARAIGVSRDALARDRHWLTDTANRLAAAETRRRERARAL